MLKQQEIHCLAPWKAICIKPNGLVVPDMQAREVLGNLHKEKLSSILKSPSYYELRNSHVNREFHSSCRNCKSKEEATGHSRRLFFDDVLRPHINNKDFSLQASPDIHFLEVNTSNKCNLKCRMCNGSISTAWVKEEHKLLELGFSDNQRGTPQYTKFNNNTFDNLFCDKSLFSNLKFLALRGGEPFIEDLNYKIIQKLVDWDLAKNIIIDVSTNGTTINNDLLLLFNKFKKIDLYISLEGVGEQYKYIRGDNKFSIEQLEENIKHFRKCNNITIIYTVTTMLYNIGSLVEIWNWFKNVRESGDEISISNTVVKPEYLNYQILPQDIKKRFLEKILNSDFPLSEYDTGHRVLRDIGAPAVLEGLKKNNYFNPDQLLINQKKFKQFNSILDQLRKTSFKSVFPELSDFYENIEAL